MWTAFWFMFYAKNNVKMLSGYLSWLLLKLNCLRCLKIRISRGRKPFYPRSLLRNQQQLPLSLLLSLLREGWRSYLSYIDELEEGPANKFLGKESIFYKKYSAI